MEAQPMKVGKARLDLLKLAAAKLNDYLRDTSFPQNSIDPFEAARAHITNHAADSEAPPGLPSSGR